MRITVEYASTINPPSIVIRLSRQEARLIASKHANLTENLLKDMSKALEFVGRVEDPILSTLGK